MKMLMLKLMLLIMSIKKIENCEKGCLSCASGGRCHICDGLNNYVLNLDSKCELVNLENCILINLQANCLLCNEGYYVEQITKKCVQLEPNNKISNCSLQTQTACLKCKPGFYFANISCDQVENPIESCLIYDSKETCAECKEGKILNLERNICLDLVVQQNCAQYGFLNCLNCEYGYSLNLSNYILDIFSQDFSNKAFNILNNFRNQNKVASFYPICQANMIPNCVTYSNYKTCVKCEENYFVNETAGCTPYPEDIINNCERYKSPVTCLQCKAGYHINFEYKCVPNEKVFFCDEFDQTSKTTICLKCSDEYYKFNDTTCIERTNMNIEKCAFLNPKTDQCQKCADDLVTTSDGLKCLPGLKNCKNYETSTLLTTQLICVVCQNEYYLEDGECKKGTINDCDIYEVNNNACVKCKNKTYLTAQKVCLKHKDMLNCIRYSDVAENICDTCDNSTILFQVERMCKSAEFIMMCVEYLNETQCKTCEEGYEVSIGKCVLIDEKLNCLVMNSDSCTKCKPDYIILNGQCHPVFNFFDDFCSKSNAESGLETENSLFCEYCKENSIPVNYKNHFLCYSDTWIQEKVAPTLDTTNCKQIDIVNNAYKCRICEEELFVNNGVCTTDCGLLPITLFDLETDNTNYSIKNNFTCGSAVAVNFCQEFSPLVLSQTTLTNKCHKCKANYYPIIDPIFVGNFKDAVQIKNIDYLVNKGFAPSPVAFFPVIKDCIISNANNLTKVTDCEYYSTISTNVFCYKCIHGKAGVFKDQSTNTYINNCDGASECTSNFYYGLVSELNGLLSCHECASPNKIPFVFGKGGASYSAIRGMKSYDLNLNPGAQKTASQGGLNFQCLEKTDPILKITDLNLPEFCAIAFYNLESEKFTKPDPNNALLVIDYLSANDSNKLFGVRLNHIAVFCIACQLGKKPVRSTTSSEATPNPTFINYMVGGCVPLLNCQSTNWFHHCSKCDEGHIYQYSLTHGVQYDTCIRFTDDVNCFSVSFENGIYHCKICNKGFIKNPDDICEDLKAPKCETHFQLTTFTKVNAPTFFYLNPEGRGCYKCADGFTSIKVLTDILSCTSTDYASASKTDYPSGTKFIKFCKKYFLDGIQFKCKECKSGYIVSSTNTECFIETNLSDCLLALSSLDCHTCFSTHVVLNGSCVKKEVVNCSIYVDDLFLEEQKCAFCNNRYYLQDGKCYRGQITNCLVYNGHPEKCITCDVGYTRVNDKTGRSYCYQNEARIKCNELDDDKFRKGILDCKLCKKTEPLYLTNQNVDKNFCSPFVQIDKCVLYDKNLKFNDSDFTCLKCEDDYYSQSTKCVLRLNKDSNCETYNLFEDYCDMCFKGYFVSEDRKTCLKNPIGIPGCKIYFSNTQCISCREEMYFNGKECIKIEVHEEIENCLYYSDLNSCSECRTGYIIQNKICKQAAAKNCLTYESINACLTCAKDSGLKKDDDITNCVKNIDSNCLSFNPTEYPFFCNYCIPGFFADKEGKCVKTIILIDKCEIYESKELCSKCEKGFVLTPDKKFCKNNIYTTPFMDTHCDHIIWSASAFCKVCQPGYFLNSAKICESCKNDGCFLCDPFDNTICYLCQNGYYMDESKKCNYYLKNEEIVVIEFIYSLNLFLFYGGFILIYFIL